MRKGKGVTKKEKALITDSKRGYQQIFGLDENLEVSFFPNGSSEIWVKDASDSTLGFKIRFSRGYKGLMMSVVPLIFTEEIQTLKHNGQVEVLQLKPEYQADIERQQIEQNLIENDRRKEKEGKA